MGARDADSAAGVARGLTMRSVPKVLRVSLWLLGAAVLAAVALAYLDPHLAVALAQQVRACF